MRDAEALVAPVKSEGKRWVLRWRLNVCRVYTGYTYGTC